MAGLKDKRGFIDKDRLDLSERKAVEYWMKRWGVTRDQLTAAHRKVGRLTKDIATELGRSAETERGICLSVSQAGSWKVGVCGYSETAPPGEEVVMTKDGDRENLRLQNWRR